jgi:hypothetical protein
VLGLLQVLQHRVVDIINPLGNNYFGIGIIIYHFKMSNNTDVSELGIEVEGEEIIVGSITARPRYQPKEIVINLPAYRYHLVLLLCFVNTMMLLSGGIYWQIGKHFGDSLIFLSIILILIFCSGVAAFWYIQYTKIAKIFLNKHELLELTPFSLCQTFLILSMIAVDLTSEDAGKASLDLKKYDNLRMQLDVNITDIKVGYDFYRYQNYKTDSKYVSSTVIGKQVFFIYPLLENSANITLQVYAWYSVISKDNIYPQELLPNIGRPVGDENILLFLSKFN